MHGWNGQHLRAFFVVVGTLALTAGCGGGGGGGGSEAGHVNAPVAPAPPGQIGAVAWAQSAVRVEHDVFSRAHFSTGLASLMMHAPQVGYWFRYSFDQNLVDVFHTFRTEDDGLDFRVEFKRPSERTPGSYTDTLSVRICYDEPCSREVPGSPFSLPLRLDVGYLARAEADITPLVPNQTTVLHHDVVGAGYSAALDAVVTVSAVPWPLLRVHDLQTGQVRSLPLLTAPTSLSVGADGLQAAVGHDAAVSLVDLRAGAESPVRRITVPMLVGPVVLAPARIVAVGAHSVGSYDIYWVDTASGSVAQAGTHLLYGVGGVVLHPAGDRIYLAGRGLSLDDVFRMDLGGDPATVEVHDSRYHVQHPFCDRVAVSPDGQRLYTGCGVVLSTAEQLADDMLYAGRILLSNDNRPFPENLVAAALSVAPDNLSVALLEEHARHCAAWSSELENCHTRLGLYDSTSLARRSLLGLAPYQRGADRLQQWGRHLMHRSDGSLIIIAEARTRNEATPTWLLHRVNP